MKRYLSLGLATAAVAASFLAVACGPDNELVPIGGGQGGAGGATADTGADEERAIDLDEPPAGLGATNTYKYNDGVVVADAPFVDAVLVADDTLTVPAAGQTIVAQLQPGTIFVGDRRADMAESNPIGFLRRVVGTRMDGANVVIDTTPAMMDDLFAEADFGGGGEPTSGGVQTEAGDLQLLDTGSASGSFGLNVNLGELVASGSGNKLKVSGAFSLSVQPRVNFRYEKRFLRVPNVDIDIQVAIRRLFGACLKAELTGGGVSISEKPKAKTFALGTLRLPIPVPPPLVVTAKFQSEATCTFTPSGAFGYATQVENNSRLRVRFGMQDGTTFHSATWPDAANTTRYEILLQGGIKAECKATIKPGIYFYDRVGGFAELVPGVTAEAAGYGKYASEGGLQGQICAGAQGKVQINAGLEADVWIANYQRKWNLWERTFPIPGLPTPNCVGTRRAADGCGGRPDGVYCSATTPSAAYQCRAGATAGGLSCPTNQFCKTRGTGSIGEQANLNGDQLACETTQPATKALDLSFCPNANAR